MSQSCIAAFDALVFFRDNCIVDRMPATSIYAGASRRAPMLVLCSQEALLLQRL